MHRAGSVVRLMSSAVVLVALAACSAGSTPAPAPDAGRASAAPAGFWTEQKLLGAREFRPDGWSAPADGSAPAARPAARTLRIGALFTHDGGGNHFCTASVVDSPGKNLIVTAAHCLNAGKGGPGKQDVMFAPGYAGGKTPFGEWLPAEYLIDPRWVSSHDERLDVAFVVLKPLHGKEIQQVTGANAIAFDAGYRHRVRVSGYPASTDAAITCENTTSEQGPGFLRFECAHFYGGTSGSPWLTDFDRRTGTGTIVGVLGGYQEGGDTPDVSYSAYLGADIKKLYQQAVSASQPGG